MPDEEQKTGKKEELDRIRNNQQLLKTQIKQMEEGLATPKTYTFQSEELREMVQTLLTQNKRLAEKVDYLLSILVQASSELSDDVFDKTLAAMAKSQVDIIDQLASIKDKAEKEEIKEEELAKMHQETDQKLKALAESISQLSYAKQLEDLKANVGTLSSDIQKLGGVISSEAPQLKENLDSLRTELAELKQKMSDMDFFGGEIKEVESELEEVEDILSRKRTKSVAELSPEDRETMEDISQKLLSLNNEIKKMEKAFESYPSSDAQAITGIKQKLDEIEAAIATISSPQEPVLKELSSLREKVNSLEDIFEQKELDMEKKREAEMRVITDVLKRIETGLDSTQGQQATQLSQLLSDLNEKTKEMAENLQKADIQNTTPKYFDELRTDVMGLGMRLGKIEQYVKQERVSESSHISDVHAEVKAIRRELENIAGMKVKPEVISQVKKDIIGINMPATKVITQQEKQNIMSIKTNINRTQEALKFVPAKEVKKGLDNAEQKVNSIISEISSTENALVEQRESIKKLRGDVLGAPLRDEDMIASYVSKLPVNTPVQLKDIATILNMKKDDVFRALLKLQKESDSISLKNTGYSSKLLGREPIVLRIK